MIVSCYVSAADGKRRPPPLMDSSATRVPMGPVNPNTPLGQSSKDFAQPEETPDQNKEWRDVGNLNPIKVLSGSAQAEILAKYFEANGAKVVNGLSISEAPGANHGISGIMEIETEGMFEHKLFVIERKGVKQRGQLIHGNGNPFDAGQKFSTLTDRLHAAYQHLDESIVALVDRIRITPDAAEPQYLELYLAVEGHNCCQLLTDGIGNPAKTAELISLCRKIGKQAYKMEQAGSPHEDCHLGNFLFSEQVFAIDFRRIAEVQLDPCSNFSEKLLKLFANKSKMLTTDTSLTGIYVEQFVACLTAFLEAATCERQDVKRVFAGLKMTCEDRCEFPIFVNFYRAVLSRLQEIDGE